MMYLLSLCMLVAVCHGWPKRIASITGNNDTFNQVPVYSTTPYPMNTGPAPKPKWENEEFDRIEEAFKFPGTHYLQDLIRENYESDWTMDPEDIRDYFEFPECDMDDFKRQMKGVYKATEDPEGTAILATRFLIKHIFRQKMKCPSNIIDKSLVKLMYLGRHMFFSETDGHFYKFLVEMASMVNFELEPYADEIAADGVKRMDYMLFNKTIEFLVGFGLRDVAFTSHSLFEGFEDYFRYYMTSKSDYYAPSMLDTMRGYMWELRCYDVQEMVDSHLNMISMFKEKFGVIETSHLCVKAEEFFLEYMHKIMPGMEHHIPKENIWKLCDGIKDLVNEVMVHVEKYESALYTRSISELEGLLRENLGEPEWMLVSGAANRLGFYEQNNY